MVSDLDLVLDNVQRNSEVLITLMVSPQVAANSLLISSKGHLYSGSCCTEA
jgi:hypothetical protein